jgi:hypothetical protein
MKGYINKVEILNSFSKKADLHKFEAIAEVISEVLPEDTTEMIYADYYHTIYTVWNIIEKNAS